MKSTSITDQLLWLHQILYDKVHSMFTLTHDTVASD